MVAAAPLLSQFSESRFLCAVEVSSGSFGCSSQTPVSCCSWLVCAGSEHPYQFLVSLDLQARLQ